MKTLSALLSLSIALQSLPLWAADSEAVCQSCLLEQSEVYNSIQLGKIEAGMSVASEEMKADMDRTISRLAKIEKSLGEDARTKGLLRGLGASIDLAEMLRDEAIKDGSFEALAKARAEIARIEAGTAKILNPKAKRK